MYCVKCGTALPEGGRFCPKCGTPATQQAPPVASAQPSGQSFYPQPGQAGDSRAYGVQYPAGDHQYHPAGGNNTDNSQAVPYAAQYGAVNVTQQGGGSAAIANLFKDKKIIFVIAGIVLLVILIPVISCLACGGSSNSSVYGVWYGFNNHGYDEILVLDEEKEIACVEGFIKRIDVDEETCVVKATDYGGGTTEYTYVLNGGSLVWTDTDTGEIYRYSRVPNEYVHPDLTIDDIVGEWKSGALLQIHSNGNVSSWGSSSVNKVSFIGGCFFISDSTPTFGERCVGEVWLYNPKEDFIICGPGLARYLANIDDKDVQPLYHIDDN